MLKEDQAAELVARCEHRLGRRLDQIRGNLKRAETRAAAVWELICIDAFAQIGSLEHEPTGHPSSPDLVLRTGGGAMWVEAAFLYPRFWENERRARTLLMWVYGEATRLDIPEVRISSRFFGDDQHAAGPLRTLPEQHEKGKVLKSPELRAFFAAIREEPEKVHTLRLDPYSVSFTYDPNEDGPFVHSASMVEEQPKTVEEHHLFRVLKSKARQHKPDCPYLICVGTDQSHAISSVGMSGVTEPAAIAAFFRQEPKVGGVIVTGIESTLGLDTPVSRLARSRLYQNSDATRRLDHDQIAALAKLDFNRWRFYFALEKWELADASHFRRSGGPLSMSSGRQQVSLTVPSTILFECLAGRTSLQKEYPDGPGESLLKCIEEGWDIVGCSLEPGSIEKGLSNRVTLVLTPPPERVFFGDSRRAAIK